MYTGHHVIDVHLHGIGDFDTQTDSPDEILRIAEIEGAEGVGGILLSLYPAPIPVMRGYLTAVKQAIEKQRSAVSNQQSDATILGVHLEGPFLNPIRCGALDPRTFLMPSWRAYRQLTEGFEDTIRSITLAPELEGSPQLIRLIAGSGVAVNMGHSDATYAEAEAGFRAGATGVTHIFNAMRPFDHRDPGIAGFALTHPDIFVEVIADPLHLHLEVLRLVFSVKPTNRILIVSDSVKGTLPRTSLKEDPTGQITPTSVITNGGRPKGGSMSIVLSSARLIAAGFDTTAVTGAITDNPARYLNLS